jgi:hypothetical protein
MKLRALMLLSYTRLMELSMALTSHLQTRCGPRASAASTVHQLREKTSLTPLCDLLTWPSAKASSTTPATSLRATRTEGGGKIGKWLNCTSSSSLAFQLQSSYTLRASLSWFAG